MSAAFSLSRISTNVRFSASALLFPELAGAWAERMFLTPPRARDAAAAALDLIDARSTLLEHKGRHIAMWRWGSRDAPAVLLAHGWGGHAAQMRAFVFPLLQAGYRVIAYDQPAHGVSEGKLTGLPDFADVLAEVAAHHGDVRRGDRAFARRRGGGACPGVGPSGLQKGRPCQPAFRPRRLFTPLRPLVLDSRASAQGDADRDRGTLRRAMGRPRGAARRAAPLGAGVGNPRPQRPHDALDARRERRAPLARRSASQHRRPRPSAHPCR